MRNAQNLIIGLVFLALTAGQALAQPAPGGWSQRPGPGMGSNMEPGSGMRPGMGGSSLMPYDHHHQPWQHGYGRPPGGWHRGDRFYGPPPVTIRNYSFYNLTPPPPGYYWAKSGDQLLMIAIASGMIASILTAPVH